MSKENKCRYASMDDWESMKPLMRINCEKLGLEWAKYVMIAQSILRDKDLGIFVVCEDE